MEQKEITPWSIKTRPLGLRLILSAGAGSVIASFYIGTGDISIATTMGSIFGFELWWTYFILGIAGWVLIDMTVRYFLRFGKTPISIFKDVHWIFSAYMFVTIIVCAVFGSYSQWNACAMVISGLFPHVPLELGGALSALIGLFFIILGTYHKLEKLFFVILMTLILTFFLSAILADAQWSQAINGLIPHAPHGDWKPLLQSNAGSLINAWLILIYPYTMMEKKWFSDILTDKVRILKRVRVDYAWGILAASLVALPLIASASAIAKPFGIVPRSYMDLSVLLEPVAGKLCIYLFLIGLFAAAWTSGVGWWLGGAYGLLDIFNLKIKMNSKPMRLCLILFFIPSIALLFLRINPIYQIIVFASFLSFVFPVMGIVLVHRISRRDMGYFSWSVKNWKGVAIIILDIFALTLCIYIGWVEIGSFFGLEK